MCDANDDCAPVITTCCKEPRPRCETAEIETEDHHVTDIVCLLGFGCCPDAKHYIAKLRARFD